MQQQLAGARFERIFDVAQRLDGLAASPASEAAALRRIFHIRAQRASCQVGPELASKYNVASDNQQLVMSVTNRYSLEQAWFNQARTHKPQTFTQASEFADPTGGDPARCDFCRWERLTAADPGFGRVELPRAVTGSNLFKYAAPGHGLVMFKHHDPLDFDIEALADLLDAAALWFEASGAQNPAAAEPFFLWNALPRAGASQFHGHAQVMLTEDPVPAASRLRHAAAAYARDHGGAETSYYADLLRAHAAVGLLRRLSLPASAGGQQQGEHVAWAFASLAPIKDAEVMVMGAHMCCPAFQRMLHAALRALIDGCGCCTFNVGILNQRLGVPAPAGIGLGRQFWRSGGGNGGSGGGAGGLGAGSASSSMASVASAASSGGSMAGGAAGEPVEVPERWAWGSGGRPPVVARLVSRGKLSSVASDFGGLEVIGGASIGHTDPFAVAAALHEQLCS